MSTVLIIGGGLAGCAAALALSDRGIASTIIEARGRLGGRALSRGLDGDEGPPVEFGGGWAHAGQLRVQALAARLGVGLVARAALVSHRHLRDGALHDSPCRPDEAAAHDQAMRQWRADAADEDPALLALSLADYLDRHGFPPSARREILSWWTISGSTAPGLARVGQLLSAKLATGWQHKIDELGFTFRGGVQALALGAARESGAGVVLSDPVEVLRHGADGVEVVLASGRRMAAQAAVVALPVNTLEQVRFEPALPAGPALVRRNGHVGRAVKLLIRARGVPPGCLVTGEAHGLRFLWSDHIRPDGSTLIIAFALEQDLPDPSAEVARAVLEKAYPGAEFLSADWHDWLADPFARGTWVGPPAGDDAHYAPEAWGPIGALAFAGSDIGPAEDQGWFEGALATAERAAAAIANLPGLRAAP